MSRALVIITNPHEREKAVRWANGVPFGTRIEFKQPKRTIPQNDRLWAMLSEIAIRLPWHGIKLAAEDWKLLFLDALKREVRMVPNIDGNGFVSLGRSSSDLSKQEFSDLFNLIEAFAANHGIQFNNPAKPVGAITAPDGACVSSPRRSVPNSKR